MSVQSFKESNILVEEMYLIYMTFIWHPTHFVATHFLIIFLFEKENVEFSSFSLG